MLLLRTFKNVIREPTAFRAQLGQTVIISIVMGLIYLNLGNGQACKTI